MSLARPDALLLAYSQVAILEAMSHGVTRNDAIEDCWMMYFSQLAPEQNLAQDQPLLTRLSEEMRAAWGNPEKFDPLYHAWDQITSASVRYSRNCLARSAAINATLLRTPEAEGIEFDSTELERVIWLLETVRRVAEGQNYLEAARAAHDASLNKPRQKRRPVENEWLMEQVTLSLDAVWRALGRTDARPTAFRGVIEYA
jgi:hypothetical protein